MRTLLVALITLVAGSGLHVTAQSDLDALMAGVLAQRDENWQKLQQYILDERVRVAILGPGRAPIWGDTRDYSWYIRDGFFVRSPTRANGVSVPEEERRRAEEAYLRRAKDREKSGAKARDGDAPPVAAAPGVETLLTQTRQPGFIDSAYFLRFKFESGRYAFVGRETFEGHDVLRVEYYPTRLFSHEQDDEDRRRAAGSRNREDDREAETERLMNKVSLVTLWIQPDSKQIVKYTFDNVHLDFLPLPALVRFYDLRAEMHMSQPFPGVWLPRDLKMRAGAMLAIGAVDFEYDVAYDRYQEAHTSGRYIVPAAE